MIYNANGEQLTSAYDKNGQPLSFAYDKDGVEIFRATEPNQIKVMEYNVGQWYIGSGTNVPTDKDAEYYALQNGILSRADADILFICEYWDVFSQTGRTALSLLSQYYPYIETMSGSSGYMGRAICSKYPLTNFTHHAFAVEGRYYDSATITIDGEQITGIVTHLNYNASSMTNRVQQLNELITYLGTLNKFICCGDLNTLDCKTTSGADYVAMIQPILNAGFNIANCGEFGFFETYSDEPVGTYTGCLDNIITSSNITITGAYVDTAKLSDALTDRTDHMPIIATLQLS